MTPQDWDILAKHGVTPDNLTVDGSLYSEGEAITALPDNLTVSHTLDISDTPIVALPRNLTVGWSPWIERTDIRALPECLAVGRWLFIDSTPVKPIYKDTERGFRLDRAGDHYHAGCRRFTAAEAIAHWGSPDYPDPERGAKYVAAVRAEEARRAK